jgi:TRAP-type C4-dicarboxylate transport system permease small subunit
MMSALPLNDIAAEPPSSIRRLLALAETTLLRINAAMLVVGMISLVFFCFAQAADRYTLKTSFDAHDQLAKVGLVWLVFTGMSLAYAAGENLRIDLFVSRIPAEVRRVRNALYEAAILLICVLLHWKGWAVIEVAGFQQIMGTPFTNALPYSALLLGTLTIAMTCIVRLSAALASARQKDSTC